MLREEPLIRPRLLAVALGTALVAASACGGGGTGGPGAGPPPPPSRLHALGELRLTSAGQAPRRPLRYRLAPGQRQGYRTSVAAEHRAVGQTAKLSAEFDWEREITAAKGASATVRMSVRRVRLVRPGSLRDAVAPRLAGLAFTATVDARGRVSAVSPAQALPAPGGQDVFARFTAPLPEDAVGEGATWERSEPWTFTLPRSRQPVRVGVRTRYRLTFQRQRGTARRAVITADLRLTVDQRAAKAPAHQKVSGGGRGTAEWVLDLARGEPATSHSEVTLDLTVTGYGRSQTLQQRLSTRTRPVRLPPPRPAAPGPRPRGAGG